MREQFEAMMLRIHFGENDEWHGKPLHEAIIETCKQIGIAGATVYRGIEGYGIIAHRALWVAGLAWLAFAKDAARGRALAWFYATALLLYWLADAREYYLAPASPMLLAAGAVCLERGLARLPRRAAMLCRGATALVLAAAFVTTSLFALPLAAIGSPLWNATASVHPQFSDRIGWPELVAQVASVYHALPEAERKRTGIYANNYGEAGAFERYGSRHGLPRAISQANSFWARGYGDPPPATIIGWRAAFSAR